eukprot:m.63441 g.63441  ORF g.63441 m.63441 type:complete len:728 (+) comp11580_c0_seq1:277-2460(+)
MNEVKAKAKPCIIMRANIEVPKVLGMPRNYEERMRTVLHTMPSYDFQKLFITPATTLVVDQKNIKVGVKEDDDHARLEFEFHVTDINGMGVGDISSRQKGIIETFDTSSLIDRIMSIESLMLNRPQKKKNHQSDDKRKRQRTSDEFTDDKQEVDFLAFEKSPTAALEQEETQMTSKEDDGEEPVEQEEDQTNVVTPSEVPQSNALNATPDGNSPEEASAVETAPEQNIPIPSNARSNTTIDQGPTFFYPQPGVYMFQQPYDQLQPQMHSHLPRLPHTMMLPNQNQHIPPNQHQQMLLRQPVVLPNQHRQAPLQQHILQQQILQQQMLQQQLLQQKQQKDRQLQPHIAPSQPQQPRGKSSTEKNSNAKLPQAPWNHKTCSYPTGTFPLPKEFEMVNLCCRITRIVALRGGKAKDWFDIRFKGFKDSESGIVTVSKTTTILKILWERLGKKLDCEENRLVFLTVGPDAWAGGNLGEKKIELSKQKAEFRLKWGQCDLKNDVDFDIRFHPNDSLYIAAKCSFKDTRYCEEFVTSEGSKMFPGHRFCRSHLRRHKRVQMGLSVGQRSVPVGQRSVPVGQRNVPAKSPKQPDIGHPSKMKLTKYENEIPPPVPPEKQYVKSTEDEQAHVPPQEKKEKLPIIPLAKVRAERKDAVWVTYRGGVYDVTSFLPLHPGGQLRIRMANGMDLSAFWSIFRFHNRPRVRARLEDFRIGNLTPEDAYTLEQNAQHSVQF